MEQPPRHDRSSPILGIPLALNILVALHFRSTAQSNRPVDGRRGVRIAVRLDRPNERSVRGPTVADRWPALLRHARPRLPVLFPLSNQGRAVGYRVHRRSACAQQPVAAVRGLRFRALRFQTGVCQLLCENGSDGNFNRALDRIQ